MVGQSRLDENRLASRLPSPRPMGLHPIQEDHNEHNPHPQFPNVNPIHHPAQLPMPYATAATPLLTGSGASASRPTRIRGSVAASHKLSIPNGVVEILRTGWNRHIPLIYFTDTFLKSYAEGRVPDPALGNKDLPVNGELELSYEHWSAAWRRFLEQIKFFLPLEYDNWMVHVQQITNREDRIQHWPLYLRYDIEVRKRCLRESFDPAMWQDHIFVYLETEYRATEAFRKMSELTRTSQNFSSNRFLQTNTYPSRFRASTNPKGFPRFPQSSSGSSSGVCFLCGANGHSAIQCRETKLRNGSPIFLIPGPDRKTYRDASGQLYCWYFSLPQGCSFADRTCTRGVHACTLCGATEHGAQRCSRV